MLPWRKRNLSNIFTIWMHIFSLLIGRMSSEAAQKAPRNEKASSAWKGTKLAQNIGKAEADEQKGPPTASS